MSKCLVTGGAGFVGSWVVDALVSKGHEVVVLDNLSTGFKDNLNPKAKFIQGDIRSDDDIAKATTSVEYIFHLASLARIQPSIEDPSESHDVNVNGTLKLLEAARHHGAKFIFSSSSSVYDDRFVPNTEDGRVNPQNPYSLQKLICEQYIKLYHQLYGLDYAIMRYFNVFGERQILEGAYAAVVGIFLTQKAEGRPLTIFGDGSKRRDFTYVQDVAKANLLMMENTGIYNVGTGTNISIKELADRISSNQEYYPNQLAEATTTLADNSKITKLGWKSTKDIGEWINEQIPNLS